MRDGIVAFWVVRLLMLAQFAAPKQVKSVHGVGARVYIVSHFTFEHWCKPTVIR